MRTKILFLAIALISLTAFARAEQVQQVSSTEVAKMLKSGKKYIVIDVRTPGEFSSGHIKGSINIDISSREAEEKIKKLDPNASYIVHCRTQNRSQAAIKYMVENGFKSIYKMTDGIVGWSRNNLPLEK